MPALDSLREARGWTLWVTEPGKTKPIKVPMHFDGTTRHSTANPAPPLLASEAEMWVDYLRSSRVKHADPSIAGYVGLGFRPQPGIGCLDLDNCVDPVTGGWTAAAHMVYDMILPGAAVEVSVSGKGLHFWFRYSGLGHGIKHVKGHALLGDFDLFQSDAAFVAIGTYFGGDASTDCTDGIDMLAQMAWPDDKPGASVEHGVPDDWVTLTPEQRAVAISDLSSALAHVSDDGNARWIQVMNALKSIGEDGKQLWFDWSRGQIPNQQGWSGDPAADWQLEAQWGRPYAGKVRRATVFKLAADAGWTNPSRRPFVDPSVVFTPLITDDTAVKTMRPGTGSTPAPMGDWDGLSSPNAAVTPSATVQTLHEELARYSGEFVVIHDRFKDRTMIGHKGQWAQLKDTHLTWMRRQLLIRGFSKVGKEDLRDAVDEFASLHSFDSAISWADSLSWDGVPRVETAMSRYFGTVDSDYSRAVAAYLFTALAGRLYDPGCQADMAVILISEQQGMRKTSCIQELVPDVEAYTTVDFGADDKELSMRVRGRLVVEIPEMVGWNKRTQAHIRDWVTRRHEQWRGMHANDVTTYPRRFVIMGTGNDKAILDDPTGARRWLPIEVLRTGDHLTLRRDRDQLWAEGITMWRQHGVMWGDAMRRAQDVHGEFSMECDPWETYIEQWLDSKPVFGTARTNGEGTLELADLLLGALQIRRGDATKSDQMRAANILRKLGYFKKQQMVVGKKGRYWSRKNT